MAVLGVDVGGTFTDAVVLDEGRVTTATVLTAPRQEESDERTHAVYAWSPA